MNYTERTYKVLENLDLTSSQLDDLLAINGGSYIPSNETAFEAKLTLLSDSKNTDELLKLLNRLPKINEPTYCDLVAFLFDLKELHPKLSYGQLVSDFIANKLAGRKLTAVQSNVVMNIKGSHNEPQFPAQVIEEVFELLGKEDSTEELIRTLKALPKPAERVILPDGVTPELLADRDYRLNSGIYKIVDKLGNLIPFHMTENQKVVYDMWRVNPRLVIDKSRQLGISTMFLVIAADLCLFKEYQSAGLVSQDMKSASTLFKKLDVILDNLPDYIYSHLNLVADTNNQSEIRFNNGSVLFISSTFRSTTLQLLHVSEVSSIGQANPAKIEELKTGSMQTVSTDSSNSIVLESTAKSGTDYFAEVYGKAKLGLNMFQSVFLSWVNDKTAVMSKCPLPINERYFEEILPELVADGVVDDDFEFSLEQKNFYTMKLDELGEAKIGQEYPTVDRESFESHFTGAILGKQLLKHKYNQAKAVPYDPKKLLFASMDIGHADYTVIIFFQVDQSSGVNLIHCIAGQNEPISHYMIEIEAYLDHLRTTANPAVRMRTIYLPHDSDNNSSSATKTVKNQVAEHYSVKVLRRTKSVILDLAVVNDMIPFIRFNIDSRGVQLLLTNLRSYSWKFTAGSFTDTPDHQSGSDFADSFRYMIMSHVVNSTKSMQRWRDNAKQLSKEQLKEKQIREANGEEVFEVGDRLITGVAKGFERSAVEYLDEYDKEIEHNTRNSTVCSDDSDGVVDGLALGYVPAPEKKGVFTKMGNKTVVDGLAI